ncbi:SDR family NAD(P)-dependent oxidoreductase, partial [Streptomyces sp. NPDC087844]|uniref:type I polyketide synthase n=1 Tax=Streptomyces sp. NPDC087844 TaxID=3365805 RepID=UPI003812458A
FIEASPHPVLTLGMEETFEAAAVEATTVPTLRRDRGSRTQLAHALAQAFTAGARVDWTAWLPSRPALDLPTYAFQHQRYWLDERDPVSNDPSSLGLAAAGHPLLGAATPLAGQDAHLLTGRLSAKTRWLAEHRVLGTVLLPGTAFAELALHAAARVGSDHVAELVVHDPLTVPDEGAVDLQISVVAPDDDGRRTLTIHSRPARDPGEDGGPDDDPWTQHASGVLAPASEVANSPGTVPLDGTWPPPGATPLATEHLYEDLADHGSSYGSSFQALAAAWKLDDDLYAEVVLPDGERANADAYGVHPVLLDAVLQARALDAALAGDDTDTVRMPFSWSGLRLLSPGAGALRVRIRLTAPDRLGLTAYAEAGAPVLTLEDLTLRPLPSERLGPGRTANRNTLFRLAWQQLPPPGSLPPQRLAVVAPVSDPMAADLLAALPDVACYPDVAALRTAVAAGVPAPDTVLAPLSVVPSHDGTTAGTDSGTNPVSDPGERLRTAGRAALALLQEWLAEPETTATLAVVTRRAVAAHEGEDIGDLTASALWGLVRSAQSEHPGQFVLLDLDGSDTSYAAVPAAVVQGEPQQALREGVPYIPRLVHDVPAGLPAPAPLDPAGTVLITGGTGALGSVVARHLVARHGVRRLLLASRRGPDAPGAAGLTAELTALGAEVSVVACDTSERGELVGLLASVPDGHPLTAVVHTAAVVRDSTIQSATAEQYDDVLRAKAASAWLLHELTRELDLSTLVLFSSVTGLAGGAGQGSYAAGNAFLDALALHRHASGLPATSLAWGFWDQHSGMSGEFGESDRARNVRAGDLGLTTELALTLLDTALGRGDPLLVPVRLDLPGMRRRADSGEIPVIFRHLLRGTAQRGRGAGGPALSRTLARLSGADRHRALLDLVRGQAAVVLGHGSPSSVPASRNFRELGFDSLTAVELRNRISAATGLRLPATLVFDRPTPTALADLLGERIDRAGDDGDPGRPAPGEAVLADLDRIADAVTALSGSEQEQVVARLEELLRGVTVPGEGGTAPAPDDDRLESATDDELFDLLDGELSGRGHPGDHDVPSERD